MAIEGTLDLEDYIEKQGGNLEGNVEFFLSGRAPYVVPEYDISGLPPITGMAISPDFTV